MSEWRYNNGYLINHTIRVAKEDFDTDPSDEYKKEIFDYLCEAANNYKNQQATIDKLVERLKLQSKVVEEIKGLATDAPELNLNNYDETQVADLNHYMNEIYEAINQLN